MNMCIYYIIYTTMCALINCVITFLTLQRFTQDRGDLPDGGSEHFA
jgi:hypothetical protein